MLPATATTLLRTGLFLLLVLGIVVRPALNHVGELHGLEHAAAAAHDHEHEHGHPHADAGSVAHADHGHAHPHPHPHEHGGDHDHAGAPQLAQADTGHDHARGHADGHNPGHSHGHGHAQGSHSLLHQTDAGASVGILTSLRLPDGFGPELIPPSSVTAAAPLGHRASPFRPPIG